MPEHIGPLETRLTVLRDIIRQENRVTLAEIADEALGFVKRHDRCKVDTGWNRPIAGTLADKVTDALAPGGTSERP